MRCVLLQEHYIHVDMFFTINCIQNYDELDDVWESKYAHPHDYRDYYL